MTTTPIEASAREVMPSLPLPSLSPTRSPSPQSSARTGKKSENQKEKREKEKIISLNGVQTAVYNAEQRCAGNTLLASRTRTRVQGEGGGWLSSTHPTKASKEGGFNKAADSTVSKVGDEVVRKKTFRFAPNFFLIFDLFFFSDNGAISSHFLRVNWHEWNVINKKLSHKMCSLKGIAI